MIQREDIVLLAGGVAGVALVLLGHTELGIAVLGGGVIGKSVVPNIAPTVVATPSVATVTGSDGKVYVKQPDGSLKPQ